MMMILENNCVRWNMKLVRNDSVCVCALKMIKNTGVLKMSAQSLAQFSSTYRCLDFIDVDVFDVN